MLGMVNNLKRHATPFHKIHTHPGGRRTRISRFHISFVVLAALVLLASCGGSSTGLMTDTPSETFMGIQDGDFKAVRFNEAGYRDSALNPTLDLQTTINDDTTTVVVSIDDIDQMYGVALNLHYDVDRYTPVNTSFSGLVDEPIELSVSKGDYVALAQASLTGTAVRSGEFATVTFLNAPNKTVSASGDAHLMEVSSAYEAPQLDAANYLDGFMVTKATAEDGNPATAMVYGVFAAGDGDQNGESSGADLTPMVALQWFNETVSDTNRAPAVVDYDGNGEVSAQDLAVLGAHFGEVTSRIEFLLGDDDAFADTDAAVFDIAWADGTYAAPTPGADLPDWTGVYRTWAPEFTLAQLQAADTNTDGTVYVSARAANDSGVGPAFTGMELTYTAINDNFIITGFDAEITNGATTPVAEGGTLDVLANEGLTFDVTGMSGTYDGTPFTPADHTAVPGTEYDDTLAGIAATVTWTAELDGAMLATTEGVVDPMQATGTGLSAMVFPDDDPDYGAGTPEGTLVVTLPASGTQIPTAVTYNMDVNVDTDPRVPVISQIMSDQGAVGGGNWYLNTAGETIVSASFTFGTIVVAEANYGDMTAQLFNLGTGPSIDFTVVPVGDSPEVGTASIRENPETPGEFQLIGVVGIQVVPGDTYALRISVPDGADAWWTSINKPGDLFEVAPPPDPADFVTMPGASEVGPGNDDLWIYYPDPRMRRNPNVEFTDGTVIPEDTNAYLDILKSDGEEFALTNLGESGSVEPAIPFPEAIVISGTDPTTITSTTTGEAGVSVASRTPNYVVLDIAVLTPTGMMTTENYAFKVFGAATDQADWPNLGTGTFDVAPMDISPPMVDGVDFGINVFTNAARGDLDLASRDYTGKNLNASTYGTNEPDVLFVEFSGGRSDDTTGANNVELIIENTGSMARMTVPMSIRAVGLGIGDFNRIGIRDFVAEDFTNPGQAGWPGVLDPGNTFNVILNSPLQAGTDDFTFGDVLVVTGVNPNP